MFTSQHVAPRSMSLGQNIPLAISIQEVNNGYYVTSYAGADSYIAKNKEELLIIVGELIDERLSNKSKLENNDGTSNPK